jgi:DNA-binding PadR family transcriptional regulator
MYDANLPGGRRGEHKRRFEEGGHGGPGGPGGPGGEFRPRAEFGPRGPGRRGGGRDGERRDDEGRGGRWGGERRGGRDRARRGDARYIILDALRDGPKHGYEIIKALEERSAGRYVPSPGTVYPTLQYLEDQGFVRAREEADRRIYQLTEAGHAELDAQAEQVTAFWKRFAGAGETSATQHELRFLREELEHLNHIVWDGLRPAVVADQVDAIRLVRNAVEECKNKVREIIATR